MQRPLITCLIACTATIAVKHACASFAYEQHQTAHTAVNHQTVMCWDQMAVEGRDGGLTVGPALCADTHSVSAYAESGSVCSMGRATWEMIPHVGTPRKETRPKLLRVMPLPAAADTTVLQGRLPLVLPLGPMDSDPEASPQSDVPATLSPSTVSASASPPAACALPFLLWCLADVSCQLQGLLTLYSSLSIHRL